MTFYALELGSKVKDCSWLPSSGLWKSKLACLSNMYSGEFGFSVIRFFSCGCERSKNIIKGCWGEPGQTGGL